MLGPYPDISSMRSEGMGVCTGCTDSLFFSSIGFFEMKMKYDESDNALIRASRAVTDKMTDLIGNSTLLPTVAAQTLALEH